MLISYSTARRGRAVSLALGYFVGAAGAGVVVAASVAESFVLLLVGSVVLGAANAAVFLTRYAAADSVRDEVRGRALGAAFFATALGAVASPLLLGPTGDLAHAMGLPRLSGMYGIALVVFGVAGVILAASASRISPGKGAALLGGLPVTRTELAEGLRVRPARGALLVLGGSNLVMVAIMAVAPVHMSDHGHGLAVVGLVISLHVAGMFAPSPVSGWLADRSGPVVVATIGFGLLVASGLAGALVDQASALATTLTLVLLGIGWNFGVVGGSTLLAGATSPRLRPHAEGIGEVTMGIAAGLGAPLAGGLVAAGGFASVWFAAALVATSAVLYVRRLTSAQGTKPAAAG